jgi:hypothetical protein
MFASQFRCSFGRASKKGFIEYTSTRHRVKTNENSSEFAMVRRPNLKSEAFSISTILGVEIIANLSFETAKKSATLFWSTTRPVTKEVRAKRSMSVHIVGAGTWLTFV